MNKLILLLISYLIYENSAHLKESIHHHIEECCYTSTSIKWVRGNSTGIPNSNDAGFNICRAYKDRLIIGEVMINIQNNKLFCKIPYYSKTFDIYTYDVLFVNNQKIKAISDGESKYNENCEVVKTIV